MPRRVIWDRRGDPIPYVSDVLGLDPYACSAALHVIKQAAGLRPSDDTIIFDDGDVVASVNGDEIGNLYDEC